MAAHFGPNYAKVTISPGPTAVYISALSQTSSPDDYNRIKLNVGPFVVPALPSQPATAPSVAGGQISAETLGKILPTKDDRKENAGLAKGLVKLKSAMIGGVVDLVTGKITSMVIPVLTNAHILANQRTTLDKRVDDIKHMCDTNNRARPGGQLLASAAARDMENHDVQLILGRCF